MATGERHDTSLICAAEHLIPWCGDDDVCRVADSGHRSRRDGSPACDIGGAPA